MPINSLTPEIGRFIARHIHAVEQLEVLCLLAEQPDKSWSGQEVYRKIQSSEKSVTECLENFRQAGLVTRDAKEAYRLAGENREMCELVTTLAKAYRERRVSVIECIYGKSSDSIQDFADAFRLRKEK